MKQRPWNAVAAALLCITIAPAGATPGPPQSCAGQPGVGGCAPYLTIELSDSAGAMNLFEYELPRIDVSRSLPLSDARTTGDLERGLLTTSARYAEDTDASNNLQIYTGSTLVDLFTLDSGGALPPGALVNIVAMVSAQGVGSIDVPYRSVGSYLHIGVGPGIAFYGGGVLDAVSVLQAENQVPTFQQFTVPLAVYANITVRVGDPFELNMYVRSIITESSFMIFDDYFGVGRGAQLSFQLPAGMRVSSMGGFDSAAPVPEPEALSLWLAGLGAMAAWLQRRRRLSQAG